MSTQSPNPAPPGFIADVREALARGQSILDAHRRDSMARFMVVRQARLRHLVADVADATSDTAASDPATATLVAAMERERALNQVLRRMNAAAQAVPPEPNPQFATVHGFLWTSVQGDLQPVPNATVALSLVPQRPKAGADQPSTQASTNDQGYFVLQLPLRGARRTESSKAAAAAAAATPGPSAEPPPVTARLSASAPRNPARATPRQPPAQVQAEIPIAPGTVVFRDLILPEPSRPTSAATP